MGKKKKKKKLIAELDKISPYSKSGVEAILNLVYGIVASLQKEPRFPQYDNIVEKIFGAGNLDGWERDEAEMLVALAKEELLKSLQPEVDIKSPFTGGKVTILSREEETTFRGEKVKITRKYYRCVDTGREFTDSKLDDDMMWAAFRAYCEKKGMTSFTDIMLKQEQPEMNLEKFTEKIKTFQARYKYPEIVSIKGAMVFMARMFYQYPNVARQWYESLQKATMDDERKEE